MSAASNLCTINKNDLVNLGALADAELLKLGVSAQTIPESEATDKLPRQTVMRRSKNSIGKSHFNPAAKDIGVSNVALKKHCVKLGINLPRQGHWLATRQSV